MESNTPKMYKSSITRCYHKPYLIATIQCDDICNLVEDCRTEDFVVL